MSTARWCSSSRRSRSTTRSSCSPAVPSPSARTSTSATRAPQSTSCAVHSTACRWRSNWLPARSKTLSIEEIARRLDDRFVVLSDPTSRKPERRRALKATIRWSYDLLFPDDQRGLWALATFAGGAPLPAVESVLAALDVPAAAAIDVVGRLASPLAGDRRRRGVAGRASVPAARQHPRVRARRDGRCRPHRGRARGARDGGSPTPRARPPTASAAVTRPSTSRSRGRSAPTSTPLWPGAWHTTRCSASRSSTGSVGPGWCSVTAGACNGSWPPSTPPATRPRPAQRAEALLLAAWLEASTGDLDHARNHIATAIELAEAIDDVDLQARCCYYLAYVVSHHGEFRQALALTDRSRSLYAGLDRPWDQAASWLFTARAAISAGDAERSVEASDQVERSLRTVDDPWLHVRRDAMLGELARMQHRFDDAVAHIARAAETSGRLGFLQTEAYQLFSLGTSPVPGGRLRRRSCDPAARDRQGRSHR